MPVIAGFPVLTDVALIAEHLEIGWVVIPWVVVNVVEVELHPIFGSHTAEGTPWILLE
jgi:hypothetical protein